MPRHAKMLGMLVVAALISGAAVSAADQNEKGFNIKPRKAIAVNRQKQPVESYFCYFGTYTGTGSKGIYVARFNPSTGALEAPQLAAETGSPSFLAIHPNQKFLYAVGEADEFEGKKSGAVSAYAIDAKTGKLTLLNKQASEGAGPCHLVVDATGKNVLVANYTGGSVASLPIGKDGKLGKAVSSIQHEGSSVNKERQEGPHAHSINVDPQNHFAFAADLGLDKVLVYRLDAEKGTLAPNDPPSAAVNPGSGPRHFAFHPSGKFAFVINEMGNTVTSFAYDAANGKLQPLQSISTLPADYKEVSHTSEIAVHPSGHFVYGSNRGHDSIAVFTFDEKSGELKLVETMSTQGKTPRNFFIDPTGAFLLAENQDSDNVVVFKIDAQSGRLTPTGQEVSVPKPCCIRMVPAQ